MVSVGARELRDRVRLENTPCRFCHELESNHARSKCVFGATQYIAFKTTELCSIRYISATKKRSAHPVLKFGTHLLTTNIRVIRFLEGPLRAEGFTYLYWRCELLDERLATIDSSLRLNVGDVL